MNYAQGMQVNIHEAKTQLSRLLELVEEGETVVIARHGRPVAELVRARKTGLPLGIAQQDRLA
jgi:prevent-host-death family protein